VVAVQPSFPAALTSLEEFYARLQADPPRNPHAKPETPGMETTQGSAVKGIFAPPPSRWYFVFDKPDSLRHVTPILFRHAIVFFFCYLSWWLSYGWVGFRSATAVLYLG
jgi:hypothetical protein